MSIAAVPNYLSSLGHDFYKTAPPGHRFTLYLRAWGENQERGKMDWRTKDRVPKLDKAGLPKPGQFEDAPNDLFALQIAGCGLPSQQYKDVARSNLPKAGDEPGLAAWKPMRDGLLDRQAIAASSCAEMLTLPAISVAPFATGLGNEHPLENGFAFLNPYGLPYLPGSSVKGVLRKAAQELCPDSEGGKFQSSAGWSRKKIEALFGLESSDHDKNHQRGTLNFWDVIPQIKGNQLVVEIMTPHQSHYYQWKRDNKDKEIEVSPHDSGSPNPISFLAVPAGSTFTFHVACDRRRLKLLAPELLGATPAEDPWRTLMQAAFKHAYDWLGFGAKTAVGYGAMLHQEPRDEALESAKAWLKESVERIAKETNAPESDVIGGLRLAAAWAALTDAGMKGNSLALIRKQWDERGWWANPPGGAKRKAKALYDGGGA